MMRELLLVRRLRRGLSRIESLSLGATELGILRWPTNSPKFSASLRKSVSVLQRTKEADRFPRQMLLAELRFLLEELERLNSGAKD